MRKELLIMTLATGLVGSLPVAAQTQAGSKVNWNDVPPAVRQTVRQEKGQAQVLQYNKSTANGSTVYHFVFDKGGQRESLDVSENGSLVREAIKTNSRGLSKVEWKDVPAAVQKTVRAQKGTAAIERLEKDYVNGKTVYNFSFKKNGQLTSVQIDENGNLLTPGQAQVTSPAAAAAASTGLNFKDLPWTVQKPMLDNSGYAKIEQVEKIEQQGKTVYVGHYSKDGQARDIRVAADGTVITGTPIVESAGTQKPQPLPSLSNASKVSFNDLPRAVQNAIKARVGSSAVEDIDKGLVNGKTVYEAAYKKDGKTSEVRVGEDGTFLGEHFD